MADSLSANDRTLKNFHALAGRGGTTLTRSVLSGVASRVANCRVIVSAMTELESWFFVRLAVLAHEKRAASSLSRGVIDERNAVLPNAYGWRSRSG